MAFEDPEYYAYLNAHDKDVGEPYCPECRPDVDPTERGKVWNVERCLSHRKAAEPTGSADPLVKRPDVYIVVTESEVRIELFPGTGP